MNDSNVPSKVILDTDMLTDCDDGGAMAVLHALADQGEAEILGVALNGIDDHGKHGAVVSAINYYYGRSDIPISATKRLRDAAPAKRSGFSCEVFDEFQHDGLLDSDRPDAVRMYLDILEAQQDASVTIVCIGFLSNLEDLLRSEHGAKMVARKVRSITIMGGDYPNGKEYNFSFGGTASATRYVLAHWPSSVPMTFVGFSLGELCITGTAYKSAPQSPMRRVYELAYNSIDTGRASWDQLAVLHGVRGVDSNGHTLFAAVSGNNHIDSDGSNTWRHSEGSAQCYLEAAAAPELIAEQIEQLMVQPPRAFRSGEQNPFSG